MPHSLPPGLSPPCRPAGRRPSAGCREHSSLKTDAVVFQHMRDAGADEVCLPPPLHRLPVNRDAAGGWLEQSRQGNATKCLAGTVGADDADKLTAKNLKACIPKHLHIAAPARRLATDSLGGVSFIGCRADWRLRIWRRDRPRSTSLFFISFGGPWVINCPWCSTAMRIEIDSTTFIKCSITIMVTPWPRRSCG